MARIWYRGEQEHWFVKASSELLAALPVDVEVVIDCGAVFARIDEELINRLEREGSTRLAAELERRHPWFRCPMGTMAQLFFLDRDSELEGPEVATNIVARIDTERPITLSDTGYRPLARDEIEWNRALWARQLTAVQSRNLPVLHRGATSLMTAISEDMGAWTAADDLYLQASSALISVLKESSLIAPKLGRAYAVDGVQTIALELNRLGFQIEVKVDNRGTQWDYQPQGWLKNTWETEGGYRVSSVAASESEIGEMIELLARLEFVCDQAFEG